MKKARKRTTAPLRVRFKFHDGSQEVILNEALEEARLRQYHFMTTSNNPNLKEIGEGKLKEAAQRLDKARSSALTGCANTGKQNADRRARADQGALAKFSSWQNAPCRISEASRYSQVEQLKKYLKVGRPKPTDREVRRLRAMLQDGRIK